MYFQRVVEGTFARAQGRGKRALVRSTPQLVTPAPPPLIPGEGARRVSPRRRSPSPTEAAAAPAEEAAAAPSQLPIILGTGKLPAWQDDSDDEAEPELEDLSRPPTAYDEMRHIVRRVNGVFMRYETPFVRTADGHLVLATNEDDLAGDGGGSGSGNIHQMKFNIDHMLTQQARVDAPASATLVHTHSMPTTQPYPTLTQPHPYPHSHLGAGERVHRARATVRAFRSLTGAAGVRRA